ncbi:MAG TPA: hypothetical protein DCM86_06635 [Verrucomicrobiales bacterium]|nr:hypothetical protein [Verrucomicrobiales bacterium]
MGLVSQTCCLACTPVLPLLFSFGLAAGSTVAAPLVLGESLGWLLAAVILKCVVFLLLERRLSRPRAVWFMLIANVLSTTPGALLFVVLLIPPLTPAAIPFVLIMAGMIRRRLSRLPEQEKPFRISERAATLSFFAVLVIFILLAAWTEGAMDKSEFAKYWIGKFILLALVASSGMIVSAVLEEAMIASLARTKDQEFSFFTSVIRTNYITLIAILLVGAVHTLPERMKNRHFLRYASGHPAGLQTPAGGHPQ